MKGPIKLVAVSIAAALGAAMIWNWAFIYNFARITLGIQASGPNAVVFALPRGRVAGISSTVNDAAPASISLKIDLSEVEQLIANTGGYALLVWHADKLILERYWRGSNASARPDSASMHKSILGILIGIAIADGSIQSIDDPIGRYIAEWNSDPRGAVTIRQLLTMTSGLNTTSPVGGPFSETRLFWAGFRTEEIMLARQLVREPGVEFDYQNINSQLLGIVLQRATKRQYSDYLSEKLWKPIKASDAFVMLDRPGGLARTYSSLFAQPRDWLKIGRLLKDDGVLDGQRIVPDSWVREMSTPSPKNPNYGLQIWLGREHVPKRFYNSSKTGYSVEAKEPFAVDDVVFFDGFGGQRVYFSRKEDLVVVRFGEVRLDWDDTQLMNLVIRAIHSADTKSQKPTTPKANQ